MCIYIYIYIYIYILFKLHTTKTDLDTLIVTFEIKNQYSNILRKLGKQTVSFGIKKKYPEIRHSRFKKK